MSRMRSCMANCRNGSTISTIRLHR
jgi:hypothetical protein